jgi:hypothetical protein
VVHAYRLPFPVADQDRRKRVVISKRILQAGLAGLAALGMILISPVGTASSAESCSEGSRKINASDMREVETIFVDGSIGHAEITLRHSPGLNCAWGLLEGTVQIWIERKSLWGTFDRLYLKELTGPSITHTAAVDLSKGPMRVCGLTFNGNNSLSVDSGVDVSLNDAGVGESVSAGRERSHTPPKCTQPLGGPM